MKIILPTIGRMVKHGMNCYEKIIKIAPYFPDDTEMYWLDYNGNAWYSKLFYDRVKDGELRIKV